MPQITDPQLPENANEEPSKKARLITAAYNIIGMAVGIISLISNLNKNTLIALLFYPLLGIMLVLFRKWGIKLVSIGKGGIYDSITTGFLITSIFVLFKSLDDYNLFQMNNLWSPFIIISSFIVTALYQIGINPFKETKRGVAIFILFVGLTYAYGSTIQFNCAFDNSNPQIYNATIIDHREEGGRHRSWYLTLSPWGPVQQVKEAEIDGWLYDHTAIGDTVKVNFKQGLFHVPWFIVTKN